MKHLLKILLVISFILPVTLTAQKKDYSGEKGYVSFKDLAKYETENRYTEIILEDNLLKLASKFAKHEDPQLAELISNLKLIQVFVVEVNKNNTTELIEKVNQVNDKLLKSNWERIVRVKDRGENVSILINLDPNADVNGLVVTSFDNRDEATFVNIVGKIDIETISRLSDKWDIPHLDKVHK